MKNIISIILFFSVLAVTSCAPSLKMTRGENYPNMYKEKPTSIVIMPPINRTDNVEAKEYFYTSLALPIAEKGYYVVSPFLAMEMFKAESAYDSELYIDGNMSIFKNVLGADAALFTIINKWSKSTIGNTITVQVEYILKSTSSNEIIFTRKGDLTVDTSLDSGGAGGLGLLVNMAASMINTALTDKVIAARRCNNYVLDDIPRGKYSPLFEKDMATPAGNIEFNGVVKQ